MYETRAEIPVLLHPKRKRSMKLLRENCGEIIEGVNVIGGEILLR